MKTFKGIAVCEGVAIGNAFVYQRVNAPVSDAKITDTQNEWEKFLNAQKDADSQLEELYQKTLKSTGEDEAEIFEMHRLMLADLDFVENIESKIKEDKENAAKAVRLAGEEFSVFFSSLDDPYMQARAADVKDVAMLLTEVLTGVKQDVKLKEPSVIIADDLTPSETVKFDKNLILGFVTKEGSQNSHTAILARNMGIPSIVKIDADIDSELNGKEVAIDGFTGELFVEPDEQTANNLKWKLEEIRKNMAEYEKVRGLPSVTLKGNKVEIYANIGSNEDLELVLANDAEGIGLFRSEFLYLGRSEAPSEEMQFAAYKNVAEKMNGKKVIIRTLDIGADKQVDYLGLDHEENPALGYRAVRICLDRPELFLTQLRAISRAAAYGNISVMFPMITSLWEVKACKEALKKAQKSLEEEGIPYGELEVGIMIETPAAVIIRDELAKEVAFFSVGTNDLTQYTLAVDRQNARLQRYDDPHHPAIIAMLEMIAKSALENGIWAGICGELAGDHTLTESFIKMGYSELSVSPPRVLPLRKVVRELDF